MLTLKNVLKEQLFSVQFLEVHPAPLYYGCASFFTKLNYFTPFFAIESERPSEDDDLVTLPEHDFHLSSSRHAISRGTLDDIMTALDS
ncbi:GL22917 [Drosophila persimilis]|uniref:GL22917 n=1 Tax=Drosophila persimilis TaxID=7234 RepID=B4HD92_DROPE|nr:GL22917 [Drosophila persimilis]